MSPVFFPSASRNEECWWGTPDSRMIYVWDSMDDQDEQTSITTLQETENWVVWKTRDKTWTHTLKRQVSHQLRSLDTFRSRRMNHTVFHKWLIKKKNISFNQDEKENISGSKIKRW